jgi:hypothetical protein
MRGAARMPTTVRATRPAIVTLITADVASSSRRSRWWTKTGTSVADRMPPRSSSYIMFGMVLASV